MEQYIEIELNTDTNIFNKLIKKYEPEIEKFKIPAKPEYQFQELTKKLFPIYGAKIFTLPYQTWYTDGKLIIGHKQTELYCKDKIPENRLKYLRKVMRGLPY